MPEYVSMSLEYELRSLRSRVKWWRRAALVMTVWGASGWGMYVW